MVLFDLDLKERIITTVKVPKIVFNDDPERILRLIRFACSLGLDIPEEEWFYAKQNAYKIHFMTKYRLRNEFDKLFISFYSSFSFCDFSIHN